MTLINFIADITDPHHKENRHYNIKKSEPEGEAGFICGGSLKVWKPPSGHT